MLFSERYQYNPKTDKLGAGGFGKVYKAYDSLLNRHVALKFFERQGDGKYGVLNELSRTIDLEHDNLVRYYDADVLDYSDPVGGDQKIEVGVMKYIAGGSLKELMQKKLSLKDKTEIILGLMHGIQYLHSRDIVHRDLKPHNILIQVEEGKYIPKITDFGISKNLREETSSATTARGTFEYMAPEMLDRVQFGIDGKVAKNIDLWSLGIVIYEMFIGDLPFGSRRSGTSEGQIIGNLFNTEIPDKVNLIPEPFQAIIKRCLVKKASDRARKVDELIEIAQPPKVPVPKRPPVTTAQLPARIEILRALAASPLLAKEIANSPHILAIKDKEAPASPIPGREEILKIIGGSPGLIKAVLETPEVRKFVEDRKPVAPAPRKEEIVKAVAASKELMTAVALTPQIQDFYAKKAQPKSPPTQGEIVDALKKSPRLAATIAASPPIQNHLAKSAPVSQGKFEQAPKLFGLPAYPILGVLATLMILGWVGTLYFGVFSSSEEKTTPLTENKPTVKPIVIDAPTAKIVPAGMPFQTRLFVSMSPTPSQISPTFSSNSGSIKPDPEGNGVILTIGANGNVIPKGRNEGIQSYTASVQVPKSSGGVELIRVEGKFTVRKPEIVVTSAAIQNLYYACGNDVNIDVPALGDLYSPRVTGSSAEIVQSTKSKQKFRIIPTGRKCIVSVSSFTNGQTLKIGNINYNVIQPPKPTIDMAVNNKRVGGATPVSKDSRVQIRLIPDADFKAGLPADARYGISGIRVAAALSLGPPTTVNTINSNGRDATQPIQVALGTRVRQARPGTKVFIRIEEIYRKNFQGKTIPDKRFTEVERTLSIIVK